MAGGQGTRFWPRSRRRVPKQLLRVAGRYTLLQDTVRRLLPLCSWERILVVCSREQAPEIRRQLPRIPRDHILVEPVGRNTAPCIALAAEWLSEYVGEALMIALPADHVIRKAAALRRTLRVACDLAAEHNCLVTVGIQPSEPHTGYGYIEVGPRIGARWPEAHWVQGFHEKPSLRAAKRYVAGRRHLWNAGMFVWKVSVVRSALAVHAPRLRRHLEGVWAVKRDAAARLRRAYRAIRPAAVDVALMQPAASANAKGSRVAVVRARFDWSDVGSWVAMPEIWGHDAAGNAAIGKLVSIDSTSTIVYSPERLVAIVGVTNVIVVDSPDAILVCARDRSQDVRRVTAALKEQRLSRFL